MGGLDAYLTYDQQGEQAAEEYERLYADIYYPVKIEWFAQEDDPDRAAEDCLYYLRKQFPEILPDRFMIDRRGDGKPRGNRDVIAEIEDWLRKRNFVE